MAFSVRNINTLDLRPSTIVGVAIPFSEKRVFTPVFNTKEQTKYNIINFLLTDRRERVFQPTFGLGLRSKIFEQITDETVEGIRSLILSGVEAFFPNVIITQLEVIPFDDFNQISIRFSYRFVSSNDTDEVILNFENGQ